MHESNISNIHKNTIMELRNAPFFEDAFPYRSKEGSSSSKRVFETINGNSQDKNNDSKVEPRRNKRARIEKPFGLNFLTNVLEGKPQTFKEAMNSIEGLM